MSKEKLKGGPQKGGARGKCLVPPLKYTTTYE